MVVDNRTVGVHTGDMSTTTPNRPRHLNPRTAEFLPLYMVDEGDTVEMDDHDLPKRVYRVEDGDVRYHTNDRGQVEHIPTIRIHRNLADVVSHDFDTMVWVRRVVS